MLTVRMVKAHSWMTCDVLFVCTGVQHMLISSAVLTDMNVVQQYHMMQLPGNSDIRSAHTQNFVMQTDMSRNAKSPGL